MANLADIKAATKVDNRVTEVTVDVGDPAVEKTTRIMTNHIRANKRNVRRGLAEIGFRLPDSLRGSTKSQMISSRIQELLL